LKIILFGPFSIFNILIPLTEVQDPPPEVLNAYYIYLTHRKSKNKWYYGFNFVVALLLQIILLYFLYIVWFFNAKSIFENRQTDFPSIAYLCVGILVVFIADDIVKSSASSSLLPLSTFGFRPRYCSETSSINFQTPVSLLVLCCGTVFLLTTQSGLDLLFNCGAFVIFMQIDGIIVFLFARIMHLGIGIQLLHPDLQKYTNRSSRYLVAFLIVVCSIGALLIVLTYDYTQAEEITTQYMYSKPYSMSQDSVCCEYTIAAPRTTEYICDDRRKFEEDIDITTVTCCGPNICDLDQKCLFDGNSNMALCVDKKTPFNEGKILQYQLGSVLIIFLLWTLISLSVKLSLKKESARKIPFTKTGLEYPDDRGFHRQKTMIYRGRSRVMTIPAQLFSVGKE